ncbi:MAG: 30S ribosome-binding factor RbfA [Bryobacterales bacterium]|nr:30S ribosome-binding factor RbfA [Bryobacterales bacterium]
MDERRSARVSEAMREELAEIVGFEMADPRLSMVDVVGVQVGPDMKHAHVMVSCPGGAPEQDLALEALERATNFLRRELARRLNLRRMPELHFEAGLFVESGDRLAQLLRRARKTRGREELS